MRKCWMRGEVSGMAAAVCKEGDCDPRQVYETHLGRLQELLKRGAGKKRGQPE